MNQDSQSFLATESVGKLMDRYAVPCIISLLVGALYNIVDQIFIANASYLGSYGNAANTVVFPLTVIALAIAVMIGDGCCAFVSISMGRKQPEKAGKSVGSAIVMTVISSLILTLVYLMAAGCIPIVGFNMGAGQRQRVKALFTRLLAAEALVGVVAFVIVEFFPKQMIAIFGAANESMYYTEFAIKAFRTYLCMVVFACVNKAAFIFLQAMGKAAASTLLSMVREVVFGVGLALLLPLAFGLDGVLYSMPASDLLTAVISGVVIAITYRQLNTEIA